MNPQRDLLGHRPTRHQHRRFLSQHLGDLTLERLDHTRPVPVRPGGMGKRIRRRSENVSRRHTPGRPQMPALLERIGAVVASAIRRKQRDRRLPCRAMCASPIVTYGTARLSSNQRRHQKGRAAMIGTASLSFEQASEQLEGMVQHGTAFARI
jgi:hypothetical protein